MRFVEISTGGDRAIQKFVVPDDFDGPLFDGEWVVFDRGGGTKSVFLVNHINSWDVYDKERK